MTITRNKKPTVFGVITSGVDKDDAVARYLDVIQGNSVAVYTSQSSDMSVLSEPDTQLFNPITSNADMEESDDDYALTALSSYSDGDTMKVHHFECTSGCGAHVIASDRNIGQYCPVCASALSEPEADEEELMDFDDSYEEDSRTCKSSVSGDEDDDSDDLDAAIAAFSAMAGVDLNGDGECDVECEDESYEDTSRTCKSSDISDEEIDDYAAIAGIDFESEEEEPEYAEEEDEPEYEEESEYADDSEDESEYDEEPELSDEAIAEFSAIAGVDLDGDGDCDVECDESEDTDSDFTEVDDPELSDDEIDTYYDGEYDSEEDRQMPVPVDNTEFNQADVLAVASSKQEAIAEYATACLTGSVTKYSSQLSGHTFYSASSAELNFDPVLGDPNLRSKEVLISTSSHSYDDVLGAHYMTCASAECGAHIVSSYADITFCPMCSSGLEEPNMDEETDELPDADTSEEETEDFSFNVLDNDAADNVDGEMAQDTEDSLIEEGDTDNEKSLSKVLNFISGGSAVVATKLNVAYCGNVAGEKSWLAFYAGQPIAKATQSTASNHKQIFEDPAYANAVTAGAEHLGVSKILDQMGFVASASVIVSEELQNTILNRRFKEKLKAMSAQLENEVADKNEDYRNRFIAALSTAAVGINRGFFKNYTNPVRHSLISSLSAVGVREADVLIDNVFRSHSDDYHKALIEKTLEIMDKPVDVQNEIAIAVSESNYMSVSSAVDSANVENRLTTLGKEVAPQQPTVVNANANVSVASNVTPFDTTHIKNVIAGLGRR